MVHQNQRELKKKIEVRKAEREKLLGEVMVKIGLERIDMQELDSGATGLVMSSEFAKKTRI